MGRQIMAIVGFGLWLVVISMTVMEAVGSEHVESDFTHFPEAMFGVWMPKRERASNPYLAHCPTTFSQVMREHFQL